MLLHLRSRGYSPRRNRGFSLRPVDSIKNVKYAEFPIGIALNQEVLAIAKDTPTTAVVTEVKRGSTIKSIWLSIDVCGLAGTGVLQTTSFYLFKNPGNNLTPPSPRTEGSSNEKKFIFKSWNAMTMRNQDGNTPYHWEGWVKIPKRYQRMGTDDKIVLVFIATTAAGHGSIQAIYKWYS